MNFTATKVASQQAILRLAHTMAIIRNTLWPLLQMFYQKEWSTSSAISQSMSMEVVSYLKKSMLEWAVSLSSRTQSQKLSSSHLRLQLRLLGRPVQIQSCQSSGICSRWMMEPTTSSFKFTMERIRPTCESISLLVSRRATHIHLQSRPWISTVLANLLILPSSSFAKVLVSSTIQQWLLWQEPQWKLRGNPP